MLEQKKWDDVFTARLSECYDEMKWLYGELYHNNLQAFNYFCNMLYAYYSARKQELKEIDRKRKREREWFADKEMLGMVMYAENFAATLRGVREHLDYIKECGVNYLQLMPLFESPKGHSDGGYAVSNFRKIRPALGNMADLSELAEACHKREISVCLDFVMNHTSDEHEWAKRAKEGEKDYQDRYFFFDNWEIPNAFEQTLPEVFPQTAPGNFTWCQELQKVVMTTFHPYQWDLNYRNPTVFNDMTANMLYLCNQGVDVIRLDAVPYIWKTLGTDCRNLKEVHTLVRLMRLATQVVCPGTLILGEVVMEPTKVVPYFGTVAKPECHMLYNVTTMATTWHTVATRDVRLLKHQLDQVFELPKQYVFLNYLRCHDDIGWGLDYEYLQQFGMNEIPHKEYLNDFLTGAWEGSFSRGELYNDDPKSDDARLCGTTASLCGIESAERQGDAKSLKAALKLDIMLHAFLFTLSGMPVLYSGDEIGQLNDYSYHDDPLKADDSRYLHRGALSWSSVERRMQKGSREEKLFSFITRLARIRQNHRVFDHRADVWTVETNNDHVLGIGRYFQGKKLIALFNFSENEQTAWIRQVEDYFDLLTKESRPAKEVMLGGHEFIWLVTGFS